MTILKGCSKNVTLNWPQQQEMKKYCKIIYPVIYKHTQLISIYVRHSTPQMFLLYKSDQYAMQATLPFVHHTNVNYCNIMTNQGKSV